MLKNIYRVDLDIKQQAPIKTDINFISADNRTSVLNIIIQDGSDVIDYNQVTSAIIIFAKSDGTTVQGNLVFDTDHYTYKLGTNEIAAKGSLICSVALYGAEGERLTASKFICTVDINPLLANVVNSSTEIDALAKAVVILDELEQKLVDFPHIKILGTYPTLADLQTAYPDGSALDGGFFVANHYYAWSIATNTWVDIGELQGPRGYSAYEIAVQNGFIGTIVEWLESLKGDTGKAFTYSDFTTEQLAALKGGKGDAFVFADFTAEQLAALVGAKGDTGLSAYEIWLSLGHTGTIQEYVASLIGTTGNTGATGSNGISPNITIGTTTTISAGLSATVELDPSSTQANPKLNFGIPKGADGTGAGDMTKAVYDPIIDNKVDKVDGKGLSTNDYTAEEKSKLSGIATEATKVSDSTTNGNILIDDVETTVYTAPDATTEQAGIVQLNETVTSTSTTQAATASSVKTTYDVANTAKSVTDLIRIQDGKLQFYANDVWNDVGGGSEGSMIYGYGITDKNKEVTITASGNWTCPAGVTEVDVWLVGGGGGGGKGTTGYTAGAGGGSGHCRLIKNIPVVSGQSYAVVIGAGGVGYYYTTYSTGGGTTSFDSYSALGGNPDNNGSGGSGGSGGGAAPTMPFNSGAFGGRGGKNGMDGENTPRGAVVTADIMGGWGNLGGVGDGVGKTTNPYNGKVYAVGGNTVQTVSAKTANTGDGGDGCTINNGGGGASGIVQIYYKEA